LPVFGFFCLNSFIFFFFFLFFFSLLPIGERRAVHESFSLVYNLLFPFPPLCDKKSLLLLSPKSALVKCPERVAFPHLHCILFSPKTPFPIPPPMLFPLSFFPTGMIGNESQPILRPCGAQLVPFFLCEGTFSPLFLGFRRPYSSWGPFQLLSGSPWPVFANLHWTSSIPP